MPGKFSRYIRSVIILLALAGLSFGASLTATGGAFGQQKNFQETLFAGGKSVRIGLWHNPPISYHGKGEAPQGFIVDIIRDIAKTEKWNVTYFEKPWAELLELLETGKIDFLAGIAFTPKRAEKYDFSNEAATNNWAVVYRSKNTTINGIGDLTGKRVALIPKNVHSIAFENLSGSFEIDHQVIPAKNYVDAMELVDSGKADVAIVARTFHFLHGSKYQAIATNVRFNPIEVRFAAPKGTGASFLPVIDSYISTQKNDPSSHYRQLMEKWFQTSVKHRVPVWFYWAFGGIIVLLGGAWLTVIWLRKQVDVRTKELQESEQRFRDFSNTTSDWLWEMDENLRFSHFSERFTEITGVPEQDLLGKTRAESGLDPDDENVRKNIEDLDAHRAFKDFEHTRVLPDGRVVHITVGGTPAYDKNGTFIGYRGTGSDITERKNLEAQLRRSQRMEAVGQLTGGVAHDFNNLLGVMIGNAEMLQGKSEFDEDARNILDSIVNSIGRGASLTQRLLAFSRQQTLAPQSTAINGLVLGLEDMLQRSLGETIALQTALGPGNCTALFDVHQFENALLNLAINARDAMPNGGKLTIETSEVSLDETYAAQHDEVTPGEYIKISVSDTGNGIAPDVLKKVIEPFFTTKEVGEGSGLGLSMVYGFAKQSHGHLTIYSELGQGTSVNLFLPSSDGTDTEDEVPDVTPEYTSGSERVLLVEDDEDLRKIPERFLSGAGYRVVEAKDSEEAIKHLLDGEPFDMLFTDVVLPGGMNGVEIAERAKILQPEIKILFTTGYAKNAIVHGGKLDPGAEVITKPYRRADFLEKVRNILDEE